MSVSRSRLVPSPELKQLTLTLSLCPVRPPPPTTSALVPLIAMTTVSFFSSAKTCPRRPSSFQPKESVYRDE